MDAEQREKMVTRFIFEFSNYKESRSWNECIEAAQQLIQMTEPPIGPNPYYCGSSKDDPGSRHEAHKAPQFPPDLPKWCIGYPS